ncbi:MAG: hypothetical protein ACRESF_08175 [Pseudomonas sp.]
MAVQHEATLRALGATDDHIDTVNTAVSAGIPVFTILAMILKYGQVALTILADILAHLPPLPPPSPPAKG